MPSSGDFRFVGHCGDLTPLARQRHHPMPPSGGVLLLCAAPASCRTPEPKGRKFVFWCSREKLEQGLVHSSAHARAVGEPSPQPWLGPLNQWFGWGIGCSRERGEIRPLPIVAINKPWRWPWSGQPCPPSHMAHRPQIWHCGPRDEQRPEPRSPLWGCERGPPVVPPL